MGSNVFSGCYSLQSMLLLGTACDYFTSGASSVSNLYLAPSVTSIKGLGISPYQVYCYGAEPAVCDASTFNSYSGTLHVPPQTLAPYFMDDYWGEFDSLNGDAVWVDDVDIALSEESVTMKIGETGQLTASFGQIPTGMTAQWFTTNSNIVEVSSNGTLTAKGVGEADIVLICGANYATCHVTVEEETVTIILDKNELTLKTYEIATITPSHTPAILPVEYTFTCSDDDVVSAQWENGAIKLQATKSGTAVITVGSSDGSAVPATCHVTVEEDTVVIALDHTSLTLNMDDIATITPSHTPAIVPVEYTFTCSDNDVIATQWKNGQIRLLATKPGTAVITVGSSDGNAVPATCEVTVKRPFGDVNGDGRLTSVDITCIYNYLLNGDETFAATSDIDGDGYITSVDITVMYNILLNGNPQLSSHEYVDLGLPSGTLWATMNVGANSPEEYGDYFAWGETTPKNVYNWSNYKWCMGSEYTMTKYCTDSYYGYNGFVDNKTELDPEDDAATANWGPEWCLPSLDQMRELIDNCTTEWITINGVNGRLFTSNINGASIFLPAGGDYCDDLGGVDIYGSYWTRTLNSSNPMAAGNIHFWTDSYMYWDSTSRYYGWVVRAVRVSQK